MSETLPRPLTKCPPWLQDEATAMMTRAASGRFPHALLVSGIDGIGKRTFGQWLTEALLCRQRTERGACGQCHACLQLMAAAHPDYYRLKPEGANSNIKIDSVRDMVDWMHLTASQGSYRVALLDKADSLNRHSANSLLKTLEEPSDNAVLILCATRLGALPATIRSRCQKVTLRMHDRQSAVTWLAGKVDDPEQALVEAGGGPFHALTLNDDAHLAARELLIKAWRDLFLHKGSVGRISDSLAALDTSECLATFSRWTMMAVRKVQNLPVGADPAVGTAIAETCNRLEYEEWFTLHDRLLRLHRSDSASFKTQAVLEGIFADIRSKTNG